MSKLLKIFVLLILLIGANSFAQSVPDMCLSGTVSAYDADGVVVSGNYAYVSDNGFGIRVIDVSDPTIPVLIGSSTVYAAGISISGNYAFVASGGIGMRVLDISNPAYPITKTSVNTYRAQGISVSGDYAYIADHFDGLKVIDITDPLNPLVVGSVDTYRADGVIVSGNYAYIADASQGIKVIDISDPTNPIIISSVNTYGAKKLFVSGDYLYVPGTTGGVQVVNISDPANPIISGSVETYNAQDIFISGSYAYVADELGGVKVLDISDPNNPTIAVSVDVFRADAIFVTENYVYVADERLGLRIIKKYCSVVADFTVDNTSTYTYNPVVFTDLSTGEPNSWLWDFGDGTTSAEQNPSHTYTTNGVYSVRLDVASSYESDFMMKTDYITVLEPLQARFYYIPADTMGYDPETPYTVTFIDYSQGGPTSWLWDFGDGNTSTDQNPTHTYTVPGVYSVRLDIANAYESDFIIKTDYIVVISGLKADFAASPRYGAIPLIVQFTDNSTVSPTSWHWNFGDGHTSTEQNPAHVYTTVGYYAVSLTVQSSTGAYTKTVNNYIIVVTPIVAEFLATPTSGLQSLAVQFTDQSTGNPTYWSWDFGDGSTSTVQNPSHTYETVGTFTVTLRARKVFAEDTIVKTNYITVLAPLQAVFSADPTLGTSPLVVQFIDQSVGHPTSWLWNFGDGSTSTVQNPNHTYATHGVFSVRLDVANSYESRFTLKTDYIVVLEPLQAGFSADTTSGTSPFIVHFTDQSKGNPTTWLWSFGDGEMSASQNPIHAYITPGLYTVSLVVSDGNTADTIVINDYITVDNATDVEDNETGSNLPDKFELKQNYPNPFNPMTEISFAMPTACHIKLEVFNIVGQKVAALVDERLSAGEHTVKWDGSSVASGVYLYKLSAGEFIETRKMVLLK